MTCSGHRNINVTLAEGQFLFVLYTLDSSCCRTCGAGLIWLLYSCR